jgi:beta-N-acetylhexosaminidase
VLSSQLKRIGLIEAAVIVLLAAGVTFGTLSLAAGGDQQSAPQVRAAVATTATTAASHGQVASVVVDAKTGEVRVGGTLKAAKPKKTGTAIQNPAPSATPGTAVAAGASPAAPATADASTSSLASAVGQMIVSPVAGLTADAPLLARVKGGHVGGIILFGPNISTVTQVKELIDQLQAAAAAGGRPKLLIMTDQEGGDVKRFLSAPPASSAAAMGAAGSSVAFRQGRLTGSALAKRGVNVDLAPVVDVPSVSHSFLGTRAFGTNPQRVAQASCQFASGLHQAGIAGTLKHFPGLGRAVGNTDNQVVHISADLATMNTDFIPYRRCANTGHNLVMVSNAAYGSITGSTPAVASTAAYQLLRTRIGFQGVAISDSLNARALASVPNLAVTVTSAGLDLQLWTTVGAARNAYDQLLSATKGGRLPAARVREAASRIRSLKESLRLA